MKNKWNYFVRFVSRPVYPCSLSDACRIRLTLVEGIYRNEKKKVVWCVSNKINFGGGDL
jgi:hypothetical protein